MSGFSKEMQDALKADAEKLSAMTGEEHTVEFFDYEEECWNCGGEGYVYNCVDEIGCVDPEGGCDFCMHRCDVCSPKREATP